MKEPKDVVMLIVDDEEALRKAIANDFKRKGYNVLMAGNGKEAFDLVKSNKIDLIISDVRMPGGDGIELLKNVKDLSPELPVVMFVTGFADMTLEDAYHKGADAVFSKPFDRKALFAAVARAITPRSERWVNRDPRVSVEFKIELQFPQLKIATEAKVLNLGRGGIYVALSEPFPDQGALAEFRIIFSQNAPSAIEGRGIVRWVRTQSTEGHPTGCGIEFLDLDEKTLQQVVAIIDEMRTKAFIPKV